MGPKQTEIRNRKPSGVLLQSCCSCWNSLLKIQETQSKYEKSVLQLKQLKEEVEEFKRNYNEIKAREHDTKVQNDAQLLEEKARLIIEKQHLEEQTSSYKTALKDFEVMKTRHTQLVEENGSLLAKVKP